MSRSNSAIIYLIVAILVLVAGIWGLNQAGIVSLGGVQPNAPAASSTAQEPIDTPAVAPGDTQLITDTASANAATTVVSDTSATDTAATGAIQSPLSSEASTAARIFERGKLVVGVRDNLTGFAQIDANGTRAGLDIEIAHEFAKRWLGDANLVDFVTVNVGNQIPTLVNGDVDLLIAGVAATRERAQLVDFAQVYHVSTNMLVVRNDTLVNGLLGLQEKKVSIIEDGSDVAVIKELIASQSLSITMQSAITVAVALNDLRAAIIDGIVLNRLQYEKYIEAQSESQDGLRIVPLQDSPELVAVALPQNDSALRHFVNFTLQDMDQDGTLAAIYDRWLPDQTAPLFETIPGQSPYQTLQELPAQTAARVQSTLDTILMRKKIIAGVVPNNRPFAVDQGDGRLDGFDIHILEEMAEHWLGDQGALEIIVGEPDELIAKLSAGEIDLVAGGLVPDRKWAEQVDFSQAYIGPPVIRNFIGMALPANDSYFRSQVNYLLQEFEIDHEYDALYDQWYGPGSIRYQIEILPGSEDTMFLSDEYRAQKAQAGDAAVGLVESTIARIKKRGDQLVVGVRYNTKPFGFTDESGQLAGFDIDLINAIAEDWGVTVSFVQVDEATAADLVAVGQMDFAAAGVAIGKEELAEVDYTQSYFVDGDALLVKRYAGITGLQDLEGKTIAAQQGTEEEILAYAATQKVNVVTVPFTEFNLMVEAVKAGQVDAATSEQSLLRQAVADNPDLAIAGRTFTQEWFGMILPPGDSNFKNLVDASLQELKKSGKYNELYKKWFGRTVTPYAMEVYPGQWPYDFATSPIIIDTPTRSKVEQILLKKKIVVGVQFDSAPFGYLDSNGELVGFDFDLAQEFAARWLGDADAVQPVRVTTQSGTNLLAGGKLDMLFASLIHSWDKEPIIDFSQSYVVDSQSLLVRANDTISTVADLEGRTVAVIAGSDSEKNLTEFAQQAGVTFDVVPFQELPAAVAALTANQVDAVTSGDLALASFAKDNPDLVVTNEKISAQPLSIGVGNYDKRFRDLVDFTLQEMKEDGSYNRIFSKWFGTGVAPANIEVWEGTTYLRGVNLIPMRRIPGSEFMMGNDSGFPDEAPAKPVTLDTYYIDQYEVTNHQYALCVNQEKCRIPSIPRSVNFAAYYGESDFGNYPVIWVTWQDAADYCAFVNKRLPSEAEWEKAARGNEGALYPWGEDKPEGQTNFGYLEKDVTSVGKYSEDASSFGVYDMAGNVREWVADWYQWDYYASASSENPLGPRSGVTKVLRGAGWNDTADQLRLTLRRNFLADSFDSNLGFRCASTYFPPGQ